MEQFRYHTEVIIECMENYLEQSHCQKDVHCSFGGSKSTKIVLEASKRQLTFDTQQAWETDPAWNNISATAKHCRILADIMQIEPETAQHLVDQSDFYFVIIYLLNHFPDHIQQVGNFQNIWFELPETAMMDHKHWY